MTYTHQGHPEVSLHYLYSTILNRLCQEENALIRNFLQRNFVSLAMLLIRITLTVGAKVLSPLSFGCQSLIHVSS